jgi:hypothetical protein
MEMERNPEVTKMFLGPDTTLGQHTGCPYHQNQRRYSREKIYKRF